MASIRRIAKLAGIYWWGPDDFCRRVPRRAEELVQMASAQVIRQTAMIWASRLAINSLILTGLDPAEPFGEDGLEVPNGQLICDHS